MIRSRIWLYAAVGVAYTALLVPAVGWFWSRVAEPLPTEELEMLRRVHHQILEDYVEDQDPRQLMVAAVRGMVSSLDRYSELITEDEVPEFRGRVLEGTYEGVGILLVPDHSPPTVHSPLEGGGAEAAGIEVGDRIMAVDGKSIAEVAATDATEVAREVLRGPPGTTVVLTIERDGIAEPFDLQVERRNVPEPRVRWANVVDPEHRIGYVHVSGCQRLSVVEFDAAIEQLIGDAGGPLGGLVLDLRQNGGGLLEAGIQLANRFLADGRILSLERRGNVVAEIHDADPAQCTLPDLPVVVLIDANTASAAEVVTGALKDRGRAKVIGMRSYGKGVVQSVFEWNDQPYRLRITTQHYYTPSGRSLEGHLHRPDDAERIGGIVPDITVALDQVQSILISRRLQRFGIPRTYRDAAAKLAAELGFETVGPLTPAEDPQLAAAVTDLVAQLTAPAPPAEPQPVR